MICLYWALKGTAYIVLPVLELVEGAFFWVMSRIHGWLYKRHSWWWPLNIPSELRDFSVFSAMLRWACEWHGHSSVVWFNAGGYEPDMHCERCGENLD